MAAGEDVSAALDQAPNDSGVADALENAHGSAPPGNVAASLIDAARAWWASGESWADRLHAYDERISRGEQVPLDQFMQLFGGFAGSTARRFPSGQNLGKSFSAPQWRRWDSLSPRERAEYEQHIEARDNEIGHLVRGVKAPPPPEE